MCLPDVDTHENHSSKLEMQGLADQCSLNHLSPGFMKHSDRPAGNFKAGFLPYSAVACLDTPSTTRSFEHDCAEMLDIMIKSCTAEDFMNHHKLGRENLDKNAARCTKERKYYWDLKYTKLLIHCLFAMQISTKDRRIQIHRDLGEFIEPLLAQFYTKDSWYKIKVKLEHPSYRIMAERARLRNSSCRETSQTLIRFSLHRSCVKVPSRDQFLFVFSLKSKDQNTILCLIRTVAYMFSDESNCEKTGAKTIQDCYEWATQTINDAKKLTTECQGRKVPVLKCICYAMIKPNALVEICNEKMKHQFQEGILHKDNYECESYGQIKSLPELVKLL